MSYSLDQGYIPASIDEIINAFRLGINTQFGTSYSVEEFVGSNHYRYFYPIAQRLQQSEVSTAEIYQKVRDYITVTNQRIQRPVATKPGLVEFFERNGYVASVKPPHADDAGKVFVCVDVDETADDYEEIEEEISMLLSQSVALGMLTQGTEGVGVVLSNGQNFTFNYDLPDRQDCWLRLTLTLSTNNEFFIEDPDTVKNKLLTNINERYSLGRDFEPQKYFSIIDAPWCSTTLLEYSLNEGGDWASVVYESDYDELFVFDLATITVIES